MNVKRDFDYCPSLPGYQINSLINVNLELVRQLAQLNSTYFKEDITVEGKLQPKPYIPLHVLISTV
jgi:hypothetical protein